jgi:hypothetical protein
LLAAALRRVAALLAALLRTLVAALLARVVALGLLLLTLLALVLTLLALLLAALVLLGLVLILLAALLLATADLLATGLVVLLVLVSILLIHDFSPAKVSARLPTLVMGNGRTRGAEPSRWGGKQQGIPAQAFFWYLAPYFLPGLVYGLSGGPAHVRRLGRSAGKRCRVHGSGHSGDG